MASSGLVTAVLAVVAASALLTGSQCAQDEQFGRRKELHNALDQFSVSNVGVLIDGGVRVWTNVSSLERSGSWIEVWWTGVSNPRLDDLIALYVPADADPTKTAPVKFKWAYHAPTHEAVGAGHFRFRVLNMRQDLKFVFLRNGLQFPLVVAESPPIRNVNPNEPTQGHISLTGRPGEMMAQWVTRDTGTPLVRWGEQPGRYTHSAPAQSTTYARQELCGPPATGEGWIDPGVLHAATMEGLEGGKTYYYIYGDEEFGWSEEYSFRGPLPAGRGSTLRVLAIADLGQAEVDGANEVAEMRGSLNTTTLMAQEPLHQYDLLVHNGDISYARGYSTQWDAFFDQIAPLVRSLPYMTTVGNHERDWPGSGDRFPSQSDSGGECGIPYYRRTQMPTPSEDEHWYSFDMGPVHFLQYSTEHRFEPGSPQYRFIEEDLRSVDRSATPWVVVGGHRPIYIDSTWGWPPDGDQYVASQLQASLEPLLLRHQVDVTWHGHHHSYQRTCAVRAGRCVGSKPGGGAAAAPVHLVIGHAGAGLSPNMPHTTPDIFQVMTGEHGYMRVTANATHLHHEVVSSKTGDLMDELILTKPPGWVFTPGDTPDSLDTPEYLGFLSLGQGVSKPTSGSAMAAES